jgi:hypothetical protein
MPYIKPEDRDRLLVDQQPKTPGELNYLVTILVLRYLKAKGPSYATYNDVLGVMSAVQHELYRRVIRHYEDRKIAENGDVYAPDPGGD